MPFAFAKLRVMVNTGTGAFVRRFMEQIGHPLPENKRSLPGRIVGEPVSGQYLIHLPVAWHTGPGLRGEHFQWKLRLADFELDHATPGVYSGGSFQITDEAVQHLQQQSCIWQFVNERTRISLISGPQLDRDGIYYDGAVSGTPTSDDSADVFARAHRFRHEWLIPVDRLPNTDPAWNYGRRVLGGQFEASAIRRCLGTICPYCERAFTEARDITGRAPWFGPKGEGICEGACWFRHLAESFHTEIYLRFDDGAVWAYPEIEAARLWATMGVRRGSTHQAVTDAFRYGLYHWTMEHIDDPQVRQHARIISGPKTEGAG